MRVNGEPHRRGAPSPWVVRFARLIDAGGPECELETGTGERRAVGVDEYGRFLLTDVPPGPARLRFSSPAGRMIVTPWFVL